MRLSLRLVLAATLVGAPLAAHATPLSFTSESSPGSDRFTASQASADAGNQPSLNVEESALAFYSAVTPEPNSFVLLGTGLLCGMALLVRRQMRHQN